MIVVALAASPGCPRTTGPDVLSGRPDVLLVTIDTARADRFSFTGSSPVSTPTVDALASEGTAFLQAIAPAPITLVSHASLLTGQFPPRHGVHNNGSYRLDDAASTLAESLRDAGYRTAAFVGAAVLRRTYGLAQGFDHYDDDVRSEEFLAERRAEAVIGAALEWLDAQDDASTFVWVHLFDPHDPYVPPEPEFSEFARALYDGEIAYVDRALGTLLEGYRSRGRYDDSLVVLTSDHGESLGEHGEETHGIFIYDATLHVPLVIRAPRIGVGARIDASVNLVDVFPTVVDLLGVEAPAGIAGRSLAPLMRGETDSHAPAYIESRLPLEIYGWSSLHGIRDYPFKLIEGSRTELYDLGRDPGEEVNLAEGAPDVVDRLRGMLGSDRFGDSEAAAERIRPDAEAVRQLRSLGYLDADPDLAGSAMTGDISRPDPRDRIHLIRRRSTAEELFDRGFHDAGIERSEAILREDPSNIRARKHYVSMLIAAGELDRADGYLAALLRDEPDNRWAWESLARVLARLGRLDGSVALDEALETAADEDTAGKGVRDLLADLGLHDRIVREASSSIEADERDWVAWSMLLTSGGASGELESVVDRLESARRSEPEEAALSEALGDAYSRLGRFGDALPLYVRAQAADPDSESRAVKLARALYALGRYGDLLYLLQDLETGSSLSPEIWLLRGAAAYELGDLAGATASLRRVADLVHGPLHDWIVDTVPVPHDAEGSGALLMLAGRYEEAAAVYEREGTKRPDAPEWPYRRGVALLKAGRTDDASASFRRAVESDPSSGSARAARLALLVHEVPPVPSSSETDGELLALASFLRYDDRHDRIAALERHLERRPGDPHLLTALADSVGPGEAAAGLYREALAASPGHRGAVLGLARLLLDGGRSTEARGLLAEVYRRSPPDLEVLPLYAEACAGTGSFRELREVLTLAAEILLDGGPDPLVPVDRRGVDPQAVIERAAETFSRVGNLGWSARQYRDAGHAYSLGSILVPDDPRPLYNVGLAWERLGDLDEALAAFEGALSLDPGFAKAAEHRDLVTAALER